MFADKCNSQGIRCSVFSTTLLLTIKGPTPNPATPWPQKKHAANVYPRCKWTWPHRALSWRKSGLTNLPVNRILILLSIAVCLSPPAIDIQHDAFRHLRRAKRYLQHRQICTVFSNPRCYSFDFWFPRRHCWQSRWCAQCSHAARCSASCFWTSQLQKCNRWPYAHDTRGRVPRFMARSVAEFNARCSHDSLTASILWWLQMRPSNTYVIRRQPNDTFYCLVPGWFRCNDHLFPCRRYQN